MHLPATRPSPTDADPPHMFRFEPPDFPVTPQLPDERATPRATHLDAAHREAERLAIEPEDLDRHLARFTPRYIGTVAARTVARHLLMLRSPLAAGEVRTRVTPTPGGDASRRELDVVTPDAPGLFAQVSGVVSLIGGQVVSAGAHTTTDGIAVDTFEVVAPVGVSTSWWARFEGELVDAVAGRVALRAAVDAAAREAGSSTTREVAMDVQPEAPWTSVRIRTGDRLGLLFTIADALAELRLDIVTAQIVTRGDMVDDVFVVRSADGSQLDDEQVHQLGVGVRWGVARLGVRA